MSTFQAPLNALAVSQGAINVMAESFDSIMVLTFPKTRGASYEASANFAAQADKHELITMGKTQYHIAAFGANERQAALALAILMNHAGKNALQVIAKGKILPDHYRTQRALQCYIESCGCRDPKAHCVEMIHISHLLRGGLSQPDITAVSATIDLNFDFLKPKNKNTNRDLVAFPCRFIRERNFKFQPNHPASEDDQIQAAAVREGCSWCPNLITQEERT